MQHRVEAADAWVTVFRKHAVHAFAVQAGQLGELADTAVNVGHVLECRQNAAGSPSSRAAFRYSAASVGSTSSSLRISSQARLLAMILAPALCRALAGFDRQLNPLRPL